MAERDMPVIALRYVTSPCSVQAGGVLRKAAKLQSSRATKKLRDFL